MRVKVAATIRKGHPPKVGQITPPDRKPHGRFGPNQVMPSMLSTTMSMGGYSLARMSVYGADTGHDVVTVQRQPDGPAEKTEGRGPKIDESSRMSGQAATGWGVLEGGMSGVVQQPLPHRHELERRFGRPLGHIEAYSGDDVREVLQSIGADAATIGNRVLFASEKPEIGTVAHEVVHALQRQDEGKVSRIEERDSAVEREAERASREVAASSERPVQISERLEGGSVALLRSGASSTDEGGVAVLERPIEPPTTAAHQDTIEAPEATPLQEDPAVVERQASLTEAASRDPLSEAGGVDPPDLQLPAAEVPGVAVQDMAVREAALADAEASLESATDVPNLLQAFASAPPTVKAAWQGRLSEETAMLAQRESRQFDEAVPELHATMSGAVAPAKSLVVESPAPREVALEGAPPTPTPMPELPDTPAVSHFDANDDLSRSLDRLLGGADTAARAEQVGESLREVRTTDPDIPRTPGPVPVVPLAGETDPQRLAEQEGNAVTGARDARSTAQRSVLDGPGPERAAPRPLDESFAVEALDQPVIEPITPADGAETYLGMALTPDVQTAFDQQQQQAMQESMAGAVAQTDQAVTNRDTARQAELETAQQRATDLSRDADAQQREHIGEARTEIQAERQSTLTAQADAVTSLETSIDDRRKNDLSAIETRVEDDQRLIENRYTSAGKEIDGKIKAGERDAEAEKRKAETKAEEEDWWDQAVGFVREAFSSLVGAIGKIFDGVRRAVDAVLDGVKAFATDLIDKAAGFIKGAIAGFGKFLKLGVDALLRDTFPALADALNRKIDDAVAYAQAKVDGVADDLKKGVAAVTDGLKEGLNRAIDAFESGVNLALSIAQAAMTGDWSGVAKKLLEAVLKIIGVDPESFYAFIGRAEETFKLILNDPKQFLGNVVDAFTGGIRLFADNFLPHLQSGIIGWLTGALGGAGITLPERFDLMGVLNLAQQILGLTWDRLRQKAVKLVGEKNVARLEHVFSYLETLVTEGWGGLWERVKGDLGNLRDQVLDGIKSFLMERVVMAAITKIASMFNPVGALVQLVLAAWNVYTFLRDQLQRIAQVVEVVINAIGDIARGILDPAAKKVDDVLARLLPLALDLLARLLGLGDVGAKVREVIGKIQVTIDRAIDKLIERVLAAFRGDGSSTNPEERRVQQEASAKGAVDVDPGADPDVKRNALKEAHRVLKLRPAHSIEEIHAVIKDVYGRYQPNGLKTLALDIKEGANLTGELVATASEPEREVITWKEIVAEDEELSKGLTEAEFGTRRSEKYDPEAEETVAVLTVNKEVIGKKEVSTRQGHAEQNVIAAHWQSALEKARKTEGQATLVLALNRSPCHQICTPFLVAKLADLKQADEPLFRRTRFILAPTGHYWPNKHLEKEKAAKVKKQVAEMAKTLGAPGRAVIEEHLARDRGWTRSFTTGFDMVRLQNAGWEHRLLLAMRETPSPRGLDQLESMRWAAAKADTKVGG